MGLAVKSYFDSNTQHRYYHNIPTNEKVYRTIINYIKKNYSVEKKIKLLDLGCGDGTFLKGAMKAQDINATFVGSDLSSSMLYLAKDNLKNDKAELFVADVFKLPINPETKFDVIHMAYLLHHIIGKTRRDSSRQLDLIIRKLVDILSKNGILIIEEVYYISYLVPHITSLLVFYGLKLLNLLHLDAGKIIDEYVPGLEVNYLSPLELKKLLEPYCGTIHLIRKDSERVPKLKRLFLLKETGYICYMFNNTYTHG